MTTEDFGVLLHMSAHDWRTALDRRLRPMGLSRATWLLLAAVARRGGLNQTELAGILGLEGASVVRLVDRLESEGLVERRVAQDRRVRTVHLTDKGAGVAAEIRKVAGTLRAEIFRGIGSEDIESAGELLKKLKTRLEALA